MNAFAHNLLRNPLWASIHRKLVIFAIFLTCAENLTQPFRKSSNTVDHKPSHISLDNNQLDAHLLYFT